MPTAALMDAPAPERAERRRTPALRQSLRYGVYDGALYSLMVGAGESYLALFVLAAGLGEVASGLVSTVPFLLGAVLQLASPWGVRAVGTLRRWVVLTASLQAASLVPLALMALSGRASLAGIYIAATVYWAASMGCGAGWTTWIGMIVPRRLRASYFAAKARVSNAAILAGLVAGGLVLERWAGHNERLWPFAVLFLLAAAGRAGCAYFLQKQLDTGPVPEDHRPVGPGELLRRFRRGRDGRFMVYMMLVQVTVQIGQPFYHPYMREQLRLNYHEILLLVGAAFMAKAATQPMWGAFARRYGPGRLLWIGGLGIIPHSALWLVSPSLGYLLPMQLLAGVMWSAYELAVMLLMFENMREEERTSLWSIFNVMNAGAMVAGSLLGGAILGPHPDWADYQTIFLVSLVARLLTVIYLRNGREITHPEPIRVEVEAVRPGAGSIDRPIIADMPETPADRQ